MMKFITVLAVVGGLILATSAQAGVVRFAADGCTKVVKPVTHGGEKLFHLAKKVIW